MFSAIVVTRSDPPGIVTRDWARKAWLLRRHRGGVRRSRRRPADAPTRGHSVFDIIGKRRWYFLFSAIITIPGLIFILLTPLTGGEGRPAVHDRLHRRDEVGAPVRERERHARPDRQVFADNGLPGVGRRHERQVLRDQDRPDRPPAAGRLADARPDRAAERRRRRSAVSVCVSVRNGVSVGRRVAGAVRVAAPSASPSASPSPSPTPPSPSPTPSASPSPAASASPGASAGAVALAVGRHRQHRPPDRRQARRDGHGARGRARPDRLAGLADDDRPGRQRPTSSTRR